MAELELSILIPALLAGLLVTATHVPLGMQVLARGIVFIDIAIAQIAGVGVIAADLLGFEPRGFAVQLSALSAALLGAALLTWTDKRWPQAQEAIIGSVFVLAATLEILLLAGNPHGGEYLRDMLVGQILWVGTEQLTVVAILTAAICLVWFGLGEERIGRIGFYGLFGLAVTASVQLVGIYLVFSSLIIPALAMRNAQTHRLLKAYAIGALGYGLGIVASVLTDLPTGPVIVWAMALIAIIASSLERSAPAAPLR
ncbi:MAG TPA: metal ABC transporter permease [Burkholderiales bacterium]|jgi:zinc/manganese transport system permease protein|nr:metal ABC transporter permease [Burkholderiales bacterium]